MAGLEFEISGAIRRFRGTERIACRFARPIRRTREQVREYAVDRKTLCTTGKRNLRNAHR